MKGRIFNPLIALSILLIFSSFQTESIEDKLIGFWIPHENNGAKHTYRRVQKFLADSPGAGFKKDGELLMRVGQSDWRGTPPLTVSYSNLPGTWEIVDSTFIMKFKDLNGERKTTWELVEVTPTHLTFMIYGSVMKEN